MHSCKFDHFINLYQFSTSKTATPFTKIQIKMRGGELCGCKGIMILLGCRSLIAYVCITWKKKCGHNINNKLNIDEHANTHTHIREQTNEQTNSSAFSYYKIRSLFKRRLATRKCMCAGVCMRLLPDTVFGFDVSMNPVKWTAEYKQMSKSANSVRNYL